MTNLEKLRIAILHVKDARTYFDRRAKLLDDKVMNDRLAAFRHALNELDSAAAEFQLNPTD